MKGQWFYELQFLMFVFMWQHDTSRNVGTSVHGIRWGRLFIWYDTAWRLHGFGLKITKFESVITNTKIYKSFVTTKFYKWIEQVDRFVKCLVVFINLYKAGFYISNSKFRSIKVHEINRFYWNGMPIKDMADIDRVGDHYNTLLNGHAEALPHKTTKDT